MSSRSETSLIDMKYAPRALQKMFIVAGILIILGAFNVYSSTYYMNMESGANPYSHILRHLVFLGVSSLLAFILSRVNYHVIKKGAFLWCLGTIGLLALVMVAGRTVNGATRWISLGPFSLQPSEIAKVTGLVWASAHLAKKIDARMGMSIFGHLLLPVAGLFISSLKKKKSATFAGLFHYFTPALHAPRYGSAGAETA